MRAASKETDKSSSEHILGTPTTPTWEEIPPPPLTEGSHWPWEKIRSQLQDVTIDLRLSTFWPCWSLMLLLMMNILWSSQRPWRFVKLWLLLYHRHVLTFKIERGQGRNDVTENNLLFNQWNGSTATHLLFHASDWSVSGRILYSVSWFWGIKKGGMKTAATSLYFSGTKGSVIGKSVVSLIWHLFIRFA